jgi:outer membrane protein
VRYMSERFVGMNTGSRKLPVLRDEWRAVAYDLHDGLTQVVMVSYAHLEAFRRAWASSKIDKAERELDQGLCYLKDAVAESRRLVNSLRSLVLDDLGLAGAWEQHMGEEKERAGWEEAEFVHNVAGRRFDQTLETVVYRVAQEALINARKHAAASHVRLLLLLAEDGPNGAIGLTLEVRDWGRGFVREEVASEAVRVGLHSMAERVGLLLRKAALGILVPLFLSASGSVLSMPSDTLHPGDPAHFGMAAMVRAALRGSTKLAIAERSNAIDRDQVSISAAQGRPTVAISGNATWYDAPTRVLLGPGFPPITLLENNSEQASLGISQPIDLSGQIRAATNEKRLQTRIDEYQVIQVRNQQILDAKRTYYAVLRSQHLEQVAAAAIVSTQSQQTVARQRLDARVGQKLELLRADSDVARASKELIQARNRSANAEERFDDMVGLPLDTALLLDDVPGAAGETIPQGTAPPLFAVTDADRDAGNLNELVQYAYSHRPDIRAASTVVDAAQQGIKLARRGLDPIFSVGAVASYLPTTSFQAPRRNTAAAMANVTIPLYDGGATRDRVQEAGLAMDTARDLLNQRRRDAALAVRQAYQDVQSTAAEIDSANTAYRESVEARKLAQLRYEAQVGTSLEVTDAQSALVAAETSQVNAVYDYLLAKAALENAIGAPVEH